MATRRMRMLARSTKTETFSTPGFNVEDMDSLLVQVKTHTAATGTTPSMVVTVEHSLDGQLSWHVLDTFTAITTEITSVVRPIASSVPFGPRVRATGTITGTTPSFDVSIDCWAEGSA